MVSAVRRRGRGSAASNEMKYLAVLAPVIGMVLVAYISTFVRSDAKKSAQAAADYAEVARSRTALVEALRDEVKELKEELVEMREERDQARLERVQEKAESDKIIAELRGKVDECVENQIRQGAIQKGLEEEIETLKTRSDQGN